MSIETVLARLKGLRRSGDGWMARCPAHQDRNPSLSIRERDEKILLHCFAGCTTEAVCHAMGIKLSDLFAKPGSTISKAEPRIAREVERQLIGLRSRLTTRERERAVTVVLANETNLDAAIARALALAVEGELVQVALDREAP
jgi:hypothetical protein